MAMQHTFSLNDSKTTLVLNSTQYSRRKRHHPIPTMMAAVAAGEPPPKLTTLALPLFDNEDDEGPFCPIICDSPFAFYTQHKRGTKKTVENHAAKSVTQCSAAAHHHDQRQLTPPSMAPQYLTNTIQSCAYDHHDHSNYNRNKKYTDYACNATSTAAPTPLVHTANLPAPNHNNSTQTLPTSPPDPWIDSLLALQCQILQDLAELWPTPQYANTNLSLIPISLESSGQHFSQLPATTAQTIATTHNTEPTTNTTHANTLPTSNHLDFPP